MTSARTSVSFDLEQAGERAVAPRALALASPRRLRSSSAIMAIDAAWAASSVAPARTEPREGRR
ncbi:MAG: hypothetical protein JO168_09665 [Solirubrobacterales bacterium]|nr:hypothetical protein [Solirubrobacterales bacterium]MBV9717402.1 hypothetical protein [Solirubrobacterales bacterium]